MGYFCVLMASEPQPCINRHDIYSPLDDDSILLTIQEKELSDKDSNNESEYGSDVDAVEERTNCNERNTDTEESDAESDSERTLEDDTLLAYQKMVKPIARVLSLFNQFVQGSGI